MASAGTLILGGNNLYVGGTVVNTGTVSISQDSNLGKTGSQLTLNAGTLLFTNSFISSHPIALTSSSTIDTGTNHGTISGQITGTGILTKNSGGTLTLSNATNNYSATTTVASGILQAGITNAFSPNSAVAIDPGTTLDVNSTTQMIPGLTGSGAVTLGTGALTVSNTAPNTFSGTITGSTAATSNALVINGGSTLILSGTGNTYTGITNISSGTLQGGVSGAFSSSSTHNVVGTLDVHNTNQTIGGLTGFGAVTLGTRHPHRLKYCTKHFFRHNHGKHYRHIECFCD